MLDKKKYSYNNLKERLAINSPNLAGWVNNFYPKKEYQFPPKETYIKKEAIDYLKIDAFTPQESDILRIFDCRRSHPLTQLNTVWSEQDIYKLIRFTFGNVKQKSVIYQDIHSRNYPSGGAMFPIDSYILMNKTIGKFNKNSVYKVIPEHHRLKRLKNSTNYDVKNVLAIKHFNKNEKESINNFSFIIAFVVNLKYSYTKYGNFSEQLAMLEAGHIAQNMQLTATILGKKTQPTGGMLNDITKHTLGLVKSEDEFVVYGMLFG